MAGKVDETEAREAFEKLEKSAIHILHRLQITDRGTGVLPTSAEGGDGTSTMTTGELDAKQKKIETVAQSLEERLKKLEDTSSARNGGSTATESELDAKRKELEAMALTLEARLKKLVGDKIDTTGGGDISTITERLQLETMARTLEERLRKLEDLRSARLPNDEESTSRLLIMGEQLQQRIAELEQLEVVLDSGALQKTANDLIARLELLEKSPRGEVQVVQPVAPVVQPVAPEIMMEVRILKDKLAASEEENDILRRELEQSKQRMVQVVQPTVPVQPPAPDPEVIARIGDLESLIAASDLEKETLRFDLEMSKKNAKELEDQIATSDREKRQLRFDLEQSQKVVVPQPAVSEPNPEVIALIDSYKSQIAAQNEEKATLILQLETTQQSANSTIQQLQGTIQNKTAAVDAACEDVEAARRDADEAKNQKNQLENLFKAREEQAKNEKIHLENLIKAREEQHLQFEAAELGANSRLQSQLSREEQDLQQQAAKISRLQSQLAECSVEKINMQREYQNELKTASDTILQLQSQVDPRVPELMKEIEGLSLEVASCQQRLQIRLNEKGELEKQLKDVQVRLENQDYNTFKLRQDVEVKDNQIKELSDQMRTSRPSTSTGRLPQKAPQKKPRDSTSPVPSVSTNSSPTHTTFSPAPPSSITRRPIAPTTTVRPSAITVNERVAAAVQVRPGRTRQLIQSYGNYSSPQSSQSRMQPASKR